jgi:hypothetical protein
MTLAPPAANLILPYEDGDWRHVAEHIRPADRAELTALGRLPEQALLDGVRLSQLCFTIWMGGNPAAVFGATPQGAIWLLGTPAIARHSAWFLRISPGCVNVLHSCSPVLWNWVDARNTVHIRWLRWLGFQFHDPVAAGVNGEMFIPFHKAKP